MRGAPDPPATEVGRLAASASAARCAEQPRARVRPRASPVLRVEKYRFDRHPASSSRARCFRDIDRHATPPPSSHGRGMDAVRGDRYRRAAGPAYMPMRRPRTIRSPSAVAPTRTRDDARASHRANGGCRPDAGIAVTPCATTLPLIQMVALVAIAPNCTSSCCRIRPSSLNRRYLCPGDDSPG